MKILIVEDEAFVAMSLKFLLEVEQHEVVGIAEDLETATAIADEAQPDLALVDLQLARGASGFDVAAELRKRDIPTLFATGNVPKEPRPDLAIGCIPKPYSDDALFTALRAAENIARGRNFQMASHGGFQLYQRAS